jgi:hypothetical protein
MPEIITCPDCQRKLRVPDDLLGKKVKCPGCSVMFTAGGAPSKVSRPAPPPAEPVEEPVEDRRRDGVVRRDDDEDDDPRFRSDDDYDDYDDYRGLSPREVKAGWGKVRTGLSLNIIGTWIWMGGAVFMALGTLLRVLLQGSALFALAGGTSGNPTSRAAANSAADSFAVGGVIFSIASVVFVLCALAEIVLRVTGFGLGLAVPSLRGSSLKPLAITAFSIAGAEAVLRLFGFTWSVLSGPTVAWGAGEGSTVAFMHAVRSVTSWIINAVCLVGFIVFLLFARSIASRVRDRGLPRTLLVMLIVFAVFCVLKWLVTTVVYFGILGAASSGGTKPTAASVATKIGIAMVLWGLLFLAYLGLEIWYIFVLGRLRDGIQRHIKKLGRE